MGCFKVVFPFFQHNTLLTPATFGRDKQVKQILTTPYVTFNELIMTGDILLRKLVAVIPSNYFSFCISKV